MGFELLDGTGSGNLAKVGDANRLFTRSISSDLQVEATQRGETFFIGTPYLTQTSATENGLLYFKSSETQSLFISTFSSQGRYTTGGTFQNYLVQVYRGIEESALTGTWVNFTPLNTNIGSSKELSGAYKYGSPAGATGFAGTPIAQFGFPINVYNQVNANIIVQKGQSILITVTPPTSNTAMPTSFTVNASLLREL